MAAQPTTQGALDVDDVSPPQCDAVPGRDVEENAAKAPEMVRIQGGSFEEIGVVSMLLFHLVVFLFFGIMQLLFFFCRVKKVHSIHKSFTKSNMSTSDTGTPHCSVLQAYVFQMFKGVVPLSR